MQILKPFHKTEDGMKRKEERRKVKNIQLCLLCFFGGFSGWYFYCCCLLINDCHDNSTEPSSRGWKGWALPCLISSGAFGPVSLNFSCFQFGLGACALAIYITMNISCCGLFWLQPVKGYAIHAASYTSSPECRNMWMWVWEQQNLTSNHFFVNEVKQKTTT